MSCSALAALAPTSAELRVRRAVAWSSTLRRRRTCSLYSLSRLSMSSSRVLSSVSSARIFSPSDEVTQAGRPPSVNEIRAAATAVLTRLRLLPGEIDTTILRPARLIRPLRIQRPARQDAQLGPLHAQAPEVVSHRLCAP